MTKVKDVSKRERLELAEIRDYQVVKANDLIQRSRFQLSSQEQKIVLYLISKIKPGDKEFQKYSFEIQEFCKLCGIENPSGVDYKYLKDTLQKLRDKSFWVKQDNGGETLFAWIDGVTVSPRSGTVSIRLNENIKPYLLALQQKFTHYSLVYILGMRSQYAIRLYELLKSYEFRGRWQVGIEELKELLSAENYKLFGDFKRRVLNTALREIKDLTDIGVNYEIIKKGRKFAEIEFTVKQKESDDQTAAWLERIKVLG
jgi:plasmid replication initiation protein